MRFARTYMIELVVDGQTKELQTRATTRKKAKQKVGKWLLRYWSTKAKEFNAAEYRQTLKSAKVVPIGKYTGTSQQEVGCNLVRNLQDALSDIGTFFKGQDEQVRANLIKESQRDEKHRWVTAQLFMNLLLKEGKQFPDAVSEFSRLFTL